MKNAEGVWKQEQDALIEQHTARLIDTSRQELADRVRQLEAKHAQDLESAALRWREDMRELENRYTARLEAAEREKENLAMEIENTAKKVVSELQNRDATYEKELRALEAKSVAATEKLERRYTAEFHRLRQSAESDKTNAVAATTKMWEAELESIKQSSESELALLHSKYEDIAKLLETRSLQWEEDKATLEENYKTAVLEKEQVVSEMEMSTRRFTDELEAKESTYADALASLGAKFAAEQAQMMEQHTASLNKLREELSNERATAISEYNEKWEMRMKALSESELQLSSSELRSSILR